MRWFHDTEGPDPETRILAVPTAQDALRAPAGPVERGVGWTRRKFFFFGASAGLLTAASPTWLLPKPESFCTYLDITAVEKEAVRHVTQTFIAGEAPPITVYNSTDVPVGLIFDKCDGGTVWLMSPRRAAKLKNTPIRLRIGDDEVWLT